MTFDSAKFTISDNGTFVTEASTLRLDSTPREIVLNHGGEQARFRYINTEFSRGEIIGWKFIEECEDTASPRHMLIIND